MTELAGPLYPVGLVVAGRACLVVGGGAVAARKVDGLLACGARVTVVAPQVGAPIAARAATGAEALRVERRPYRAGEAASYRLVITATGDPAVDRQVFDDAEAAGVWVNAADQPARCSFTLPAVERRGAVTVAVATDGSSPALASWLRDRLADALPDDLDEIVAVLGCRPRAAAGRVAAPPRTTTGARRSHALTAASRGDDRPPRRGRSR